jgi:predicted MFS family arabinose efflux permease
VDFVVIMPLAPHLMADYNLTPASFATLVSSYNFSGGLFGLIYGFYADHYDRKKMLNLFLFGFIITTLLCSLAPTFEWLLISRTLTGCFGGIVNAIVFAIVTDIVPIERRGRGMGVISSAFSFASVFGVPLGLAIADYFGWQAAFVMIAIVGSFILILSVMYFPKLSLHLEKKSTMPMWQSYKNVLMNSKYWMAFLFIFMVTGSIFVLIPFLGAYAVKNMGIKDSDLKYMYLVGGLVTIITARIIGIICDRYDVKKVLITLILISFIPITLYTQASNIKFVVFIVLSAFFMSLVSGRMIPSMTIISQISLPEDRGSFMSITSSIRAFGSAVLTTVGGLIVYEGSDGRLVGFHLAGYLAIALGMCLIMLIKFLKVSDKSRPN